MTKLDWCDEVSGIDYITNVPKKWELLKKGSGIWITVPKGFVFQSSVPRLLWWVFDPHDPVYLWAACLHDWLLKFGARPASAAAAWYDGALSCHAPKLKTKLAHIGIFRHTVR